MTAGRERLFSRWALVGLVALCGACDDDPTAGDPVCGAQATLTVGTPIEAALTNSDARFAGAHIDYYAVQSAEPTQVTFRMASTEIQPLLLVFDSDGDVAAQAFQATAPTEGGEWAPSLVRTLATGCTLIGASAYGLDETGAYELSVEPTS